MAANEGPEGIKGVKDVLQGVSEKDLKKMQAMLGNGKKQRTKLYFNEDGADDVLAKNSIDPLSTIVFKDCKNGVYKLEAMCTKITFDCCENLTVEFTGKIVTSIVEIYKCNGCAFTCSVKAQTIQADLCEGLQLTYQDPEHFHQIIWAGTNGLRLAVGDRSIETGYDAMAELPQFANLRRDIDQFIIRDVEGKILSEKLVRLVNGYPSTQREIDVYDENQEKNMRKMAESVLGKDIVIPKKKDEDAPKVGRNEPCPCGSGKKAKKCNCTTVDLEK